MARGGIVTVKGEVFVSSHNNQVTNVALGGFRSGVVKISEADETPGSFIFTVNDRLARGGSVSPLALDWYRTFISPFLTVSWRDPAQPNGVYLVRQQLGLYILLPESREAFARSTNASFECRDLTWLLSRDKIASQFTVSAGTRYVDAIATILSGGGISRSNIAYSSRTSPIARSWPATTSRLKIANDLLGYLGYWPLWADWTGRLTSRRIDTLDGKEPVVTFSTAAGDVVESVVFDPDLSLVANRIIVIGSAPKNNAGGAPIKSVRNNTRSDSPTSQTRLGIPGRPLILAREIQDARIETQADADALAASELAKGTNVLVRMGLKLRPNPLIDFRQPVKLDVRQEDGTVLADGKWGWDELSIGFTPGDGAMSLRCAKVLPYGEVS